MLSFPNAKVNLGLNIVSKRPDGYHDIESCFYPIPLRDVLEIIPAAEFQFTSSGLEIPGDPQTNLCVKAYHLLKKDHNIPPVHIHLHKVISMGAGLGGGSADGAFTIKMFNQLFGLNLTTHELEKLAGKLGSDCPFFIRNKPVFVTGTGAEFTPVNIDLSNKFIALKHPKIHVSTKEAYSKVIPKTPKTSITEILARPAAAWRSHLQNDFEASVFLKHPVIGKIKDQLYDEGAFYASMTGSGAAVYGIFDEKPELPDSLVMQL